MKPGMSETEKLAYAKSIGASVLALYDSRGVIDDAELDRRILAHERANREEKLWLVAVIAAVASVVSALAAWAAVVAN